MAVDKVTGFAAPYRSLTFRKFLDEVISRNGIMSMSGEVTEAVGIVTIPPFTFNQAGLIVNVSTQKQLTKPTLTGAYLLIVSAPTTGNVDDLVYTFAESPLDVDTNEVVIAEWDGNEWRQLPLISVDEIIKGQNQDRLDFSWDGPISGFITSVDGLSYRNTAGVMIDRQGRKARIDDDQLFGIIADDSEASWNRVDRMIWRRQTDDEERVGVRKLLLGGTYSSGTQLVNGPQVIAGPPVHSRVKAGLFGNEAVVLTTEGFGASFGLYLGRVADDRSGMSQVSTLIAGVTAHTDEVDMVVDQATGDCFIVYVNSNDIFFVHTDSNGNVLDGPVQINTQTQPCSHPKIVMDRAGKLLITFLALMAPLNNQVFFASCDETGAAITGSKRVTNTATNHIHQDMIVTPDYVVYLVYEDLTQGKIYYDTLNDIGNVTTVAPVYVSANVVSNSYGTNSDSASLPKIRVTDTRDLFIFFLQDIGGDKKLVIVKNDAQGYSPDIISPSDNFNTYDVVVSDWMNDIYVYLGGPAATSRYILVGENAISQASVLVGTALSVSVAAQSVALLQDQTGSLFLVQTDALPGTYSDVGTPESVEHIGPAVVVGGLGTVNLASNQVAFLTASLSQTPVPGQRMTISGAADPLNDGAKLVVTAEIADYNLPGEYTVVTLDATFNSAESPAVVVLAQFAEPDGMAAQCFKSTAELLARALRQDILDSDILLARIITPGPTILNYVQNPVFSGGTTALSLQFGVYGSSQIDWEDTNPGEFTIQTSFGIVDLFNALDYTILAGSHAMAEGDALYVLLDGANFAVSPQVTPVNTLPWSTPIQVLGFIKNGNFVPVLFALAGGDEMVPGEIIVIGEDLPEPLRSRLGLLTDTTYEDYTETHRILLADNYPQAISKLDRAARDHDQDRNIKLIKGGTWSFNSGATALQISQNTSDSSNNLVDNARYVSQGFTPAISFSVNKASIYLGRVGGVGGTVIAEIRTNSAGVPSATVLATSAPVLVSSIVGGGGLVDFLFASPPALTNGTIYHVVLNTSGVTGATLSDYVVSYHSSLNPYAGGQSAISTTAGVSWVGGPGSDLRFQIYAVTGAQLTFSADAYVQVAGLQDARNTILATALTLADGEVAYVSLNRLAGANANLAITIAAIAVAPLDADSLIIARRLGNDILVGNGTIKLAVGESQTLESGMSDQSLSALGLPSEVDEGQLRIMAIVGSKRIRITPTDKLVFDATTWGNEISGLAMKFDGIQIDLETGNYYGYGDGTLAGSGALIGSAFTPTAFTNPNVYRWYSINFVADTVASDGRMQVKPLILAGTPDATSAVLAIKAVYSSKKLGQVLVQATGTGSTLNTLTQARITQLTSGAGGGSGASAKMIGGGIVSNTVTETPLAIQQNIGGAATTSLAVTQNQFIGQTIQVGSNRYLKDLTFRFNCPSGVPSGRVRAHVYEITSLAPSGAFAGVLLGSSDMLDTTGLTVTFTDHLFTFASPILARTGKFYAVVLKNVDTLGAALLVRRDSANPITGAMVTGNTGSTIATSAGDDLYFILNASTYSSSVAYDKPFYVEQARLNYADNRIAVSSGPWVLSSPDHVAYVDRLNASSGGANLTVTVGLITDTKDGQLIIARRDGDNVIVGSSSTRLRPGQSAKLFAPGSNFTNQDRGGKLVAGGTWSVEDVLGDLFLNWDDDAYIDIPGLNKTSNLIVAPSAPLQLDDGQAAFVNIDRVGKPAEPEFALLGTGVGGGSNFGAAAANGQYVFTADQTNIYTWDVSNPASPVIVSTYPTPVGTPVGQPGSMVIDRVNNILYSTMDSGGKCIGAFNVANPLSPVHLDNSNTAGGTGARIALTPDLQYVFLNTVNLWHAFNVSNPSVIGAAAGSFNTGAGSAAAFPSFSGNVMYTGDVAGLIQAVNITNKAAMVLLDSIALGGGGAADASVIIGNVLFATATAGLVAIDISDPSNLAIISTVAIAASAFRIHKDHRGDFIHVSSIVPSLTTTVDVSDPSAMVVLATYTPAQDGSRGDFYNGFYYLDQGTFIVIEVDLFTPLDVLVEDISELDANNDDLCIIARRESDTVYVGSKSMALTAGQYAELDGAIPELYRRLGQLSMTPHPTNTNRVVVNGANVDMLDSSVQSLTIKKLLMSFNGAQIDFSTGVVYAADGVTLLGLNFTPFVIPANQYFYYSVSLIPSTVNANNTINVQLLVLPATAANAVLASAPRPVFPATATPVGYVWVKQSGGGIAAITYTNIGKFGAGTGSGSAFDQAALFQEDLKRRLEEDGNNLFWMTPNIIALHEDDRIDGASTGSYDVANNEYDLDAAEIFKTIQHYGAEFLKAERDNLQIELQALWSSVDDAATYEVTKDGVTFEPVTMERVGESTKFRGMMVFSDPAGTTQFTHSGTVNGLAEFNATTRQKQAIPLASLALGVKKKVLTASISVATLGAPQGQLLIKIVKATAGVPGTTVVGQNSTVIDLASLTPSLVNTLVFEIPAVLVQGDYWLVFETSALYKSTFSAGVKSINLRTATAAYAPGFTRRYDGVTWTSIATNAIFNLLGYTYDLRVRVTASQTSSLYGIGILYGEQAALTYESKQNIERFDLDGNADVTEITVTRFIPDPATCRAYLTNNDTVIRFPRFALDGRKFVFPAGTFYFPGQTVIVIIDQSEQTVVDNSEMNASLLAANRLGSTDPTIDRSAAGEGPLIRADNDTLVEASLKWNGAAYEWVFAEV